MAYNTGATFYPGGEDSYYLPEVVAPAPQRSAEHPVNMEQNVAQMEQQAARPSRIATQHSVQPQPQTASSTYSSSVVDRPPWDSTSPTMGQSPSTALPGQYVKSQYIHESQNPIIEKPNFSPFPVVRDRGPHVPPSDEEREATIDSAREAVLASDDFEMQLTWAQDALLYVEVARQNEQRISQTQAPRPRTPRVEHALREDAMKVVSFLADQHHPRAEFIRGMWYEFGKFDYRVDKREAFNCYTRSIERGYWRGYYRIGMQFENSNDALKAIKYYQYGVDKGDAASCYRLGMMALLGQHGQPLDYQRGLQLIQMASDNADDNAPQGAYVLGMLQAGELAQVTIPSTYLAPDIRSAKMNIERAAFLGFAKAQVRMGSAYELGDLGCPGNAALSLHYYHLAARQGEADAEMSISKWFLSGQEEVFAKNEEMAFTYAQRAAVSGLSTAQFAMGYFYEVGIYVPSDLKKAQEWYRKADENGNEEAGKRIAAVARSKTMSRKDHENYALRRIRAQQANGGQMPPPSDGVSSVSTLEMPDASRLSLNSTPASGRPGSTAPYPSQDMGYAPPRSSSAFGINPNLRPASGPGPRPDPYRMNEPNMQRPYGGGRMGPGPGSGPGYGRGGRVMSGPNPQGYGYNQQQGPMRPPTASSSRIPPQSYNNGTPTQSAQSTPQIDIGFSAPPDPNGADRRDPARRRPPPGPSQALSQVPAPGSRPSSTKPYPQQRPMQAAKLEPSRPPRGDSITPRPGEQKPLTVSASAAANGNPGGSQSQPGKGPKTFDEMGIPPSKKEGDCVVM